MRPLPLFLCLLVVLPGCARLSASPVNPLNWFGINPAGPQMLEATAAGPASLVPEGHGAAPIELRVQVDRITSLQLDPSPDGVVVTASGMAAQPGAFNAALVETGRSGGTLTLEMRSQVPQTASTGAQRITAGVMLRTAALSGISTIVVTARDNSLSARR